MSADRRVSTTLIAEIERLKGSVDCRAEIGRSINLKRAGVKSHVGLCPFHPDKTPSLYVYRDHYHCFSCQAHGDVFDWIKHNKGLNHAGAIRYLGGEVVGDGPKPDRPAERERRAREREAEVEAERANDRRRAQRLFDRTQPVQGMIGERNLISARAIPAGDWPDAIRWLPWHPMTVTEDTEHGPVERTIQHAGCWVAVATLPNGQVSACQRIFVDSAGRNVKEFHKGKPRNLKRTTGTFAGGLVAVRLPGDEDKPLIICEGPETGLGLWRATGWRVWIAIGSVEHLILPTDTPIVLARDDDPQHSPADKSFIRAVATFRKSNVSFRIATPWVERRFNKSDFNDLIKSGGCAAVKLRIEAALLPPAKRGNRKTLDHARGLIRAKADEFCALALKHDPEGTAKPVTHAIRTDVGTGKSRGTRGASLELITKLRVKNDKRIITVAVPTHALGVEAAGELEAMTEAVKIGAKAAIWRGREAPDPDANGELMCRDMDRVRDAQDAGEDAESGCCKAREPIPNDPTRTLKCPFYDICGYQRQKKQKGDVWFVAHEMLFNQRPAAIGELVALIVDESVWQSGLEGDEGANTMLTVDTLAKEGSLTGMPGQRLDFLRGVAIDVLRAAEIGPVARQPMLDAGLTSAAAAEARSLELERKVDPEFHPAMTVAQRKAAAKVASGNRTIRRMGMFWHAIEDLLKDGGPEASGWAALAVHDSKEGPTLVLHLKRRKQIAKGWQAPTMIIDATLNIDLVRPYWPNVELVADVAVETPYQYVRQTTDRSNSKRHLELHEGLTEKEREIRTRHLRELNATIAAIGRAYAPGRTLVVTQKAINDTLCEVGVLSPRIDRAWHNAISGRDEWKHTAALVVVGRTAPAPAAVERIAEALTGRAMARLPGWYPKVASARPMANGGPIQAECDRHPDPICEAVRWQINEGELIQIVGRARGVNRKAADPVDIWVLTDTVLDVPLTEVMQARDTEPGPRDLMLGCDGIALENATNVSRAFADLWPNREAVKKAFQRSQSGRLGTFPYNSITYTRMSPTSGENTLQRWTYQLTGPGRSPSVAWVDPTILPDPTKWLTDNVGILAWCKPDPEPDPPAAQPTTEPSRPTVLILPPSFLPKVKTPPWQPPQPARNPPLHLATGPP